MRLPMIKYGNIALTTTITLLTLYHLYLLLLVRLGGYIVNLSDFYSYRIIGKLTDFFAVSGVQLAQQYRWGVYHFKNTYSPITLGNISSINLVSIFRCSSSAHNSVNPRRVNSSTLVCSLSLHRNSYIGFVFSSRFNDS